jgi:hypothetical protein
MFNTKLKKEEYKQDQVVAIAIEEAQKSTKRRK